MEIIFQGVFIGVIATLGMDIWAAIVKHLLHLPTADWALVGRWFGHMPRGVLVHRPIADSAAIPSELAIGWVMHYLTGIVYGLAYLGVVQVLFSSGPTLASALVFRRRWASAKVSLSINCRSGRWRSHFSHSSGERSSWRTLPVNGSRTFFF